MALLKYKKEYPQMMIDAMKKGYSQCKFAAEIGVAHQTITDWINKYPDFAQAVELGKMHREVFFEQSGIDLMTGKSKGNARVWELICKNHFGLKDKVETEISGNMNVEQSISIVFVNDESDINQDE
jgi:transcriptional regulator with XRE-family HTH domain